MHYRTKRTDRQGAMGELVPFPGKKRKHLRPNRSEGRPTAAVKVFPIIRSAGDFLDAVALDVAAGVVDVSEAVQQLYESRYWRLPRKLVQNELSRAGGYLHRRANEILKFCGFEEIAPPTEPRRSPEPDLPPAA